MLMMALEMFDLLEATFDQNLSDVKHIFERTDEFGPFPQQ